MSTVFIKNEFFENEDTRCRACLQSDDMCYALFNKYDFSEMRMSLAELLMSFTSLQISEDDGLTQLICSNCKTVLEELYKFRLKCEESEKTLKIERENALKALDESPPHSIGYDSIKEESDDEIEEPPPKPKPKEKAKRSKRIKPKPSKATKTPKLVIKDKPKKTRSSSTAQTKIFKEIEEFVDEGGKVYFKCAACDENFEKYSALEVHKASHEIIRCKICKAEYKKWHTFFKHFKLDIHTNPEMMLPPVDDIQSIEARTCDLCKRVFLSRSNMIKHRRRHFKPKGFTCTFCGVLFENTRQVLLHMEAEHPEKRLFKCDKCEKSFFHEKNLKVHKLSHSEHRSYVCDTCGLAFTHSSYLATHIRLHTGVKPYKCSYCDKSFTQQSSMKSHEVSHTGIKKHLCKVCGKTFTRSGELANHRASHETERPFACKVCGKTFKNKKVMRLHMTTHSAAKKFACEICGKAFRRSTHLKVHSRVHTGEKPYSCSVCSKSFTQAQCLRSHLQTAHQIFQEKKNNGQCFKVSNEVPRLETGSTNMIEILNDSRPAEISQNSDSAINLNTSAAYQDEQIPNELIMRPPGPMFNDNNG